VALPSHFLGVTFALPPGFDQDSAHSARGRSVPRIARLPSSSAGGPARDRRHEATAPSLRYCAPDWWRMRRKAGPAPRPGVEPLPLRGVTRAAHPPRAAGETGGRPVGAPRPHGAPPDRTPRPSPASQTRLPVPPGTEGRPGPGTGASLIPDRMGFDVTPAMLPFPAHLRAFCLPFQMAEHRGQQSRLLFAEDQSLGVREGGPGHCPQCAGACGRPVNKPGCAGVVC
jgi:hypothetical protein